MARTKTDIAVQILMAASNGSINKAALMYQTFLCQEQLTSYLDVLLANSLIENDVSRSGFQTSFRTSRKGRRFLAIYNSRNDIAANVPIPNKGTHSRVVYLASGNR
jgi:predicted transcriptional regulator